MIATVFLLAAGLFATPVFASEISSQKVEIDLKEDGSARAKIEIDYSDLTSSEVYYLVYAQVTGLSAQDEAGYLLCRTEHLSYGSQISCLPKAIHRNGEDKVPYKLTLEFDIENLVDVVGEVYHFSYGEGVRIPTNMMDVSVTLPEGMGLIEENGSPLYSPPGATIESTGRRVIVHWALDDASLGQTYSFLVSFEKIAGIPIPIDNRSLAIAGIGAIALAAVGYIHSKRKGEKAKIETVYAVLMPGEKAVLDVIKAQGGKCRQRVIVKETNYSKAKVSRLMVDLEARGLIEKERVGRTNMIKLVEKPVLKPKQEEEKPKGLPGLE